MKKLSLIKSIAPYGVIAITTASIGYCADLSPGSWPQAERERLEKLESQTMSPLRTETVEGSKGIVSATVSPVAVYAGIEALKLGGTAADAAAAIALTQITRQLGSVVSYAGVFTMLYYDARTQHVYSMDAGFNSYLQETDPSSIPVSDLGLLPVNSAQKPTQGGAKGRETLVPGFMAGVEAMHGRFGRLPFRDLFEPALWYAEHGIRISPALHYYFASRESCLSRTPEGRQFIHQAGGDVPKAGDLFIQTELSKTLKAIGENGSRYMYTGQWGEDFFRIVRREGGQATTEDMQRYEPIWSEPYKDSIFGHAVYVNGPPHIGAYALLTGLNLAEALKLDRKGAYWTDPEAFQDLARISQVVARAPALDSGASDFLRGKGIDISAESQLSKDYARAVAPLLGQLLMTPADSRPSHSNAIIVVDKDGNIAVVTHTINAVIWGDTGIVVDGIPIPDAAGYQQASLAAIKPGDRVPHQIIDAIALDGDKPVLATASIGSSLIPESIRVLLGVLGQDLTLTTLMAAPPLLQNFGASGIDMGKSPQPVSLPEGAYTRDFVEKVKALGLDLKEMPATTAAALRGTLAAVTIDPQTGKRSAVNQPNVMVFNSAE